MKMTIGELKRLIRQGLNEARWLAKPPKRLKDMLEPIEVEAPSSKEAAQKATDVWHSDKGVKGLDPYSIDLEKLSDEDSGGGRAPKGKGSPIVFRLGTRGKKITDALEAKGFEVWDGVVYDPQHWDASGGGNPGQGLPMDYPGGAELFPKSQDAKRILDHVHAIAKKAGRTASSVDMVRDAWQGDWEKEIDGILG